ncbi:MAG TPA: IPT/TIG domain-containing protein [Bacteroidales bacterium]|nr:IPT/TIG domain-containing protein [Bacteroidales bacterium]
MRYINKISLFILVSLLLSACEKNDETPGVKTLDVEFPDDGGVILNGELQGASSIIEYGFYYSRDSLFSKYETEIISFNEKAGSGSFHAAINSGLEPDAVYFFKAYIYTNGSIMFGKTKAFLSTGNKPPEILQVIPEIAHIADTVEIFGKNFGRNNYFYYMQVNFSGARAQVLNYNDSLITCIIPEDCRTYRPQLKVTVFDKSDSASFQLYKPVIESFTPTGTFRDTITITGQHFDKVAVRNEVSIGSTIAAVISSSREKLKVLVPDNLNKSIARIKVTAQLQSTTSETPFKLKTPVISAVPECSFSDSEIELKGKFFNPVRYYNKVLIEDVESEIISVNTESIIIKVPYGPFPRGYAHVKIQVADTIVDSGLDFCIEDNWLMISNTLPFTFYGDVGTFTIGNTAYVISHPHEPLEDRQYLWKFNTQDYTWKKYSIPFDLMHTGICTTNGVKGYVYTATETDNFWEFDPLSDTWTQKADFPAVRRDEASAFSVNRDIYVGIGSDFYLSNDLALHDFYKYDPGLNIWTRISDLDPDSHWARTEASTFVIDNIAYLTCGARNTGMYDAWKYIYSTDKWIRIADFPDARHYTGSFVLNNKGYITNGSPVGDWESDECWEYDPVSNDWKSFYPIGHKRRYRGFAFSVNGKAFAGGGYGGANSGNTTWELYLLNK